MTRDQKYYKDGYHFWDNLVSDYGAEEAKEKAKRYLQIRLPDTEYAANGEIIFRNELIRALEHSETCSEEELVSIRDSWKILVRFSFLYAQLKMFLDDAPSETECSNEENEVYANMQNLRESIDQLFIAQARN